jgi:Cu(I)/Ag(I) efflux system membrane fusion protein
MKDKILSALKVLLSGSSFILLGLVIGWMIFAGTGQNTGKRQPIKPTTQEEHSEHQIKEVWTCSMHPQIRQNEAGDCPICGMDLIVLADNNGNDNPIKLVMSEEAAKLAHIETLIVGEGDYSNNSTQKELFLTGKVKMDETKGTTQAAHIEGRIEKLFVTYTGERVRKGQKVAVVYAPELISAQKELLEALKLKEKYPELHLAAREKIRQWKIPEATIDEIENSGNIQREVTIFAEYSGLIMKRFVDEGDYIKRGMPLFDVMDLSRIWVLFDVYEKDMQWVKVGTTIEFNFDAMPQKNYRSRITFIDPIINPRTRVAAARVEISNSNGFLKPDMFAKGIVRATTVSANRRNKSKPITIPKTAVLWTGTRSVVYIKDQEMDVPTFEFKEVLLGADLGASYIIEEGISNGEEVVVNGVFRIDAAAQLSNKTSMMNRLVSMKSSGSGEVIELPSFTKKTPDKFKKQLSTLVEDYLILKDHLVATDFEAAKTAVATVDKSFSKVDMLLVKGAAHAFWMKQTKGIRTNIDGLQNAKDVDKQRMWFSGFSKLLAESVKVYGLPSGSFFIQHCPMALDDKGADWLSKETKILNPYFGDKMLKCGTVQDSLIF